MKTDLGKHLNGNFNKYHMQLLVSAFFVTRTLLMKFFVYFNNTFNLHYVISEDKIL